MTRRSLWSILAFVVAASGCPDCIGDNPDAGPPGSASGTLVLDGEEQLYSVDPTASKLIILNTINFDQVGCGVFHSHAIEALSYSAEFFMDQGAPAASTWTFEVPAQGLDPDDPENRALFPETDSEMLSEGDRGRVKVSVLEELRAEEHPTLTFAARDFSTFTGEGTAAVDVTLNGITSEIELEYDSTLSEEGILVVKGTGIIDGTPHAIPNPDGVFSSCISPIMELYLDMTLAPGGGDGPPPAPDAGPDFEPMFFPWDDGCPDAGGFDEVHEIFMRRCVGCHMDPQRLGASEPLIEWEDFRVDTARGPGEPLFMTVEEFILLPETASLHMPPLDVSPLTPDELNAILDWTEAGAPPDSCSPTPLPTFTHTPESLSCGTVGWAEDVQPIFNTYSCMECHAAEQTGIPALVQYSDGLELTEHPLFEPLNLWEVGIERMKDGSMPPNDRNVPAVGDPTDGGPQPLFSTEDIATLDTWVSEGFPEARCP